MLHPPPAKINTARRSPANFPITSPAVPAPPASHQKCKSREELTPEEKLLAEVIALDHRIPVGFQIGMPMRLARATEGVQELFTEHNLPLREELIGELTPWREHAEQGLKFSEHCDRLMQKVIRVVGAACKDR